MQPLLEMSPAKSTDRINQLPHYLELIEELKERLLSHSSLGLIVINIHGMDPIEETHGPDAFDEIMELASQSLKAMQGKIIRADDFLMVSDLGGCGFMIFVSETRAEKPRKRLNKKQLEKISGRIHEHLFPKLSSTFYQYSKDQPKIAIGSSLIVNNPLIRPRRLIYRLIEDAKQMARLQFPLLRVKNKERLQQLILKEEVSTVFQPIYYLASRKIMGYEALARGPKTSAFESPLTLFSVAKEVGLIFELDRLCRNQALSQCHKLPENQKIFINTLPTTIHDPEFRGKHLKDFLKSKKIQPENIVFEINERVAIDNFSSFREAIKYYTDLGISIAIDDAGTGYSSLEAIVELRPQFLKFDMSMVRGIGRDPLKQEMLKMLSILADKINAEIIAEGIENLEELNMLRSMGLQIGQGFYFSKPLPVEQL